MKVWITKLFSLWHDGLIITFSLIGLTVLVLFTFDYAVDAFGGGAVFLPVFTNWKFKTYHELWKAIKKKVENK